MWGSDIKKLDVGLPQGISETIDALTFEWLGYGFFIDNLDIVATGDCCAFGNRADAVFAILQAGPGLTGGGRRPSGGVECGNIAQLHLGAGLVDRGFRRIGRGDHVGHQIRRAVLLVADCAEGAACSDARRFHLDPRCHRRRADYRGRRETFRVHDRSIIGGATENWFAYVLALLFLVFRPQGLFGDKIIERV